MKNKSVTQLDCMGCGIACVAYVRDISYKEAKNLFDCPNKASTKGYTIKHINNALFKFGLNYKSKYIGRVEVYEIKDKSLVYFKKCYNFPYGHYMVKTELGYMDPFINLREVNYDIEKAESGFNNDYKDKIVLISQPI